MTTSTILENVSAENLKDLIRQAVRAELKSTQEEPDKLMTLKEFTDYLPETPARQTIYGWVNDRKVPYEKHGKNLYFRKSAIDAWLNNGRR